MIKKILISQPQPTSDKSPYFDIAKDYDVDLVFRPFIKVEGLTSKEFRQQKVSITGHTAIVFTSRHAIDNFFKLAKEMRLEIPEDMKYFCVTEQIAFYIQKYVQYRKRKVFFGQTLDSKKLQHTECIMYRTVSNDFTEEEVKAFDYDMCVFLSPAGISAFTKTFGSTKNDIAVATFGPSTSKSAHEAGLNVVIEAPSEKFPSMTGALKSYLARQDED